LKTSYRILRILALATAIWIGINLILVPLNWDVVFHDTETTTGVEMFVILGFLFTLIFDISSIPWIIIRRFKPGLYRERNACLLAGSILCLFVLIAIKVMADEVGRESRMGLGAAGEYIIFNVLLLLHIAYNLYFYLVTKKKEHLQIQNIEKNETV
jgi:hypothetical protein